MKSHAQGATNFRLRFSDCKREANEGRWMENTFVCPYRSAILPQGFSLSEWSLLLFTQKTVSIVFRATDIYIFFVCSTKYFRGKTQQNRELAAFCRIIWKLHILSFIFRETKNENSSF